jgi:hypothetical protein
MQHRAQDRSSKPQAAELRQERIIAPVICDRLKSEIDALPQRQVLVDADDCIVCHARAAQIPSVLNELGRLREITFRATGEGTGKSLDIDRFDEHYIHLFVWNRPRSEIVGAYRLGPTDQILQT